MIAPALAALVVCAPPVGSVEELPRLLQEEFDLLEALEQLDVDRQDQERALAENQKTREEVIGRRDRAAKAHRDATTRLSTERDRIRRRIHVYIQLQKMKTTEWLLLATAGDYATWLKRRHVLERLMKDDEERIKTYHATVKHYRNAEAKLEKELKDLQAVELRIKTARATLIRDTDVKATLLESVRTEKLFYAKAGKDLDKAAQKLQERIDAWQEWQGAKRWFRDLKGQYSLPVKGGKILLGYGNHTHPKFQTVTMHRGLDIGPGKGGEKTVHVMYPGKVVFAGILRGYGNTVIVDHTNRDFTLYAHLAKILVKEGDIVESKPRPTKLGILGETGSFEGERLYFEIRIDGQPVDPGPWFQ